MCVRACMCVCVCVCIHSWWVFSLNVIASFLHTAIFQYWWPKPRFTGTWRTMLKLKRFSLRHYTMYHQPSLNRCLDKVKSFVKSMTYGIWMWDMCCLCRYVLFMQVLCIAIRSAIIWLIGMEFAKFHVEHLPKEYFRKQIHDWNNIFSVFRLQVRQTLKIMIEYGRI